MGNSQYDLTKENMEMYEKQMLGFSKIPYEEIKIDDVVIDDDKNHIRTFQVGDVSSFS